VAEPLLEVRGLEMQFSMGTSLMGALTRRPHDMLRAVDGVDLEIARGETLGLVGESGCGKSTVARALLNLVPTSGGSIRWFGQEMSDASPAAWQKVRSQVQIVFQDPLASLNPRMNIAPSSISRMVVTVICCGTSFCPSAGFHGQIGFSIRWTAASAAESVFVMT